jgi:hypothetical protein
VAARSERREALRQALAAQIGEDEAATLMEQLPPFDWSRLATKDDLARLEDRIDERFVGIDERFRSLERRFDGFEQRVDDRFIGLERRFDDRFVGLERRFDDQLGGLANRIDDRFDAFQRFQIMLVVSTVLATAAAVAGAVVAGASI